MTDQGDPDSVWLIIPARYASTRYPAKPLAMLRGAGGGARSLIGRAWDAGRAVAGIDRVLVATDDDRIAEHAAALGAEVVMTDTACANGTERCADALRRLGGAPGIVVNLQGDAPLTPPWFVEALVAGMRADPAVRVATPVLRADAAARAALVADRRAGRVGGTTAVFDRAGRALYFSKEVLPYAGEHGENGPAVWHHVGVYAYRPEALAAYATLPPGPLEAAEGLEQLRFLENGWEIACVEVAARGAAFWELNNPEDVARIEAVLRQRGVA